MAEANKRTVFFFKNVCSYCNNDIDFPLLGNFSDYEFVFQTVDGKDFLIASIYDNISYDFIVGYMKSIGLGDSNHSDYKKILVSIADKLFDKEFSSTYPVCPFCQKTQNYYTDEIRTTSKDLSYATWNNFESLTDIEKEDRINKILDAGS